ncbi:uncharacterized protein LOC143898471 isoform X2 [Temnothorax americanus]|uniref:uncharacterized protein LOC143898471 isoform X2 n=1 Tax=Temnothorax americanus TaxID=1964332 RepID=UPI0040678CFC
MCLHREVIAERCYRRDSRGPRQRPFAFAGTDDGPRSEWRACRRDCGSGETRPRRARRPAPPPPASMKMARASSDVSRTVRANTIQENERKLQEARIKNQGKGRGRQDLNKLFGKLNQAVETSSLKFSDKSSSSCNRSVSRCWYGPILGFPSGSWWGILMDCSRDRMHEPFDADVHEGPFGVVSVCTSHNNVKEDVDLGDYLTLTGQVYREDQPSVDPFVRNYENQIPLRLIRSYNLQDDIAPNTGYRYDGLYVVVDCWIGVASDRTRYNKFALMRLGDQEPPNWGSKGWENLSSVRRYVPSTKSDRPNTYDLRKCSNNNGVTCRKRKLGHGGSREGLSVALTTPSIDIGGRSAPESSIVTRHVFKKLPSNPESAASTSVPDQKMLLCLGASATKTHGTNISIRMGLYESSHSSQDAKKSVSTMLQKPSKPIDITVRTALDMESSRLTPKEDVKPTEKTDADKTRINSRPNENVSYNGHVATDNASASPLDKHGENSAVAHSSKHSCSVSSSLSSLKNGANTTIERKERPLRSAQQFQDVQNLSANDVVNDSAQKSSPGNESPRNSIVARERISECRDSLDTPSESFCAQSIKSLDSLTPDKILNLIDKEMHHPLSKLLIGNVIGLTIEECEMWNASERETTPEPKTEKRASTRANLRKKRKGADDIKENVACLDNGRYYKYSRSERLFWKVTKQADGQKFDKLLPDAGLKRNNNVRRSDRIGVSKENNEYLSPFRVQTSLRTIAQRHTRSSYDIKTRLRADKGAVLAKPDFPNSSIKKNKYKKRDREIANLTIDANFGPITRGPRNRRLRCRTNGYARCCGTFNTVIYGPNKRFKSSFERKSKLKVGRQRAGERQTKDKYGMTSTVHASGKDVNDSIGKQKNLKGNPSNDNNENRVHQNNNAGNRKKANETETADHNVTETSFNGSLRKKLTRTIPLPHRAAQTSRLSCFRKKQDGKPNTMDATTQCRLISDNPEVCVIGQLNDQRTILKMEWDKLEKLKETALDVPDQGSRVYRASRNCATSTLTEDNVSRKSDEGYADSLQDRASAFVPVNAFNSDLRIARLRSIGFKPIIKPPSPLLAHDLEIIRNALVTTSKVTKRDVAEEYHKYANNEDNNAVVYMDDELQYQDIEEEEEEEEEEDDDDDEDEKQSAANASMKSTLSGVRSKTGNMLPETLPARENSESPWHGWKKIVTDDRSYWIGW